MTHFSLRSMTALHVSPFGATPLTTDELHAITKSIQQFQLGEGSKGQRLLARARKFANAVDDPEFVGALELFIKEEQQHSQYLAAFMQSQGIPLVSRHWVDSIFRKLRGLAGLDLSLTVLVTAEIIAVPYYRALRGATGSAKLKMICTRILDDETGHLRYQASMLGRAATRHFPVFQHLIGVLHSFFLRGTMLVVWREHRTVFEAGGYDFERFKNETLFEFLRWNQFRVATAERTAGQRRVAIGSLE